ncbi:MAG: hypothetical protein LC772_04115, partial [Chloroflexi bacterium]|nr:hypothetical protein [Chloroflexota bacterium]
MPDPKLSPTPRLPSAGWPPSHFPASIRPGALAAVLLLALAMLGAGQRCRAASTIEVCRIRIENRTGGEISASSDDGHSYNVVGHVLAPATTLVRGFSATAWAQDGTVCATAVHGIRVCVAHRGGRGLLFSLIPREYRRLPDSFGGQRSGSAGIYTDIAAATSIFRNLAPLVGNPVFVERQGVLHNIRPGYIPEESDVLVIVVAQPSRMPEEIDFDNRVGGVVEEIFSNGERTAVARVVHPVYGIGRYDATSYTGVGRINTNHPGVITISTTEESGVDISDEERGWERRGGFQIVPSVHASDFHAPPPAMMIVAPPPGSNRPLEGTPPLFSGLIGLNSTAPDDAASYRVQVRIDRGPWEQMPDLTGIDPLLFTAGPLSQYFAHQGVKRTIR